jgi:hypothetical protein
MTERHVDAAMWITAMLVGFAIWWPVGLMILSAITIVALAQQVTGVARVGAVDRVPPVVRRVTPMPLQVLPPPVKQIENVKRKYLQ